MSFRVGQKVARVGSTKGTYEDFWILAGYKFSYPKIGEVVTIKTINDWPCGTILTFCEHDNSHLIRVISKIEPGFGAEHFRPVVERKSDISIFTEMLTDTKVPASVMTDEA